jgi:uncharacterized protein involved in tellurium resistance
MLNEFPRAGYVTLLVPLDARIQIHTEIQTTKYRHCAVIHIGRTNYRIKVGDIIHWTGNHEIYWTPAGEEYEEPKPWRNGQRRKLFLDRIVSEQTYAI